MIETISIVVVSAALYSVIAGRVFRWWHRRRHDGPNYERVESDLMAWLWVITLPTCLLLVPLRALFRLASCEPSNLPKAEVRKP